MNCATRMRPRGIALIAFRVELRLNRVCRTSRACRVFLGLGVSSFRSHRAPAPRAGHGKCMPQIMEKSLVALSAPSLLQESQGAAVELHTASLGFFGEVMVEL